MAATILVTGGAGYIGSHTVVELIAEGYQVVIIDNLSNAESFILDRIESITGQSPVFYNADLCDAARLEEVFKIHSIDVVVHFAAYKAVGESVKEPLKYFQNNIVSLLNVLTAMQHNGVQNIIFSSSATVYGIPDILPVTEQTPFQKALSAYGSTKQMGEEILEKTSSAGAIKNISLRYFNPVGAHSSGLIGELPKGTPNNLFPYVMQVATGKLDCLTVYGNDYETPDGYCVRDYIHVVDLAKAHVKSCRRLLDNQQRTNYEVFNIGTGHGTSVMEIIQSFERVTGQKLKYTIGIRREGDAPVMYADTTKAERELGWSAQLDLDAMLLSAWNWELTLSKN